MLKSEPVHLSVKHGFVIIAVMNYSMIDTEESLS